MCMCVYVCIYLSLSICLCLCVYMPWHSCGGQRTAFRGWSSPPTMGVLGLNSDCQVPLPPAISPTLPCDFKMVYIPYLFIYWSLPHTLIQRPGTMKAKGHPDDMTATLRREGVKRAEASWDKPTEKMRSCSKFCLFSQGGCDICTHSLTLHPRWGSCLSSLSREYFYIPRQC